MNLLEKVMLKIIQYKIRSWFNLERTLIKKPGYYTSVKDSPQKTWPDPDKIPLGNEIPFSFKNIAVIGLRLKSSVHQGIKAITSLKNDPQQPLTTISPKALQNFESAATALGVGALGYVRLPRKLIFKERAVRYDKAIVLLQEMDKDKIAQAPSLATFKMVFQTYDALGITVNILTDTLRQQGFGAQGGHPLGGLTLYPPLAEAAGLGSIGRHGLLITPQFGPRQRIAAIFTSIENFPFTEIHTHTWITDFCKNCGRCIQTCPTQAILEHPISHASGRKTHIIRSQCLPQFVNNQGCTICVKECPFSHTSYHAIQQAFLS